MADILVTGGAGFIGSNFVRYWREQRNQGVVVLDALTYAGNAASIADVEGATLVEGDICDTDLVQKLLRDNDIRTIVHFAAESHVDRSITGPHAFVQTNVIGTHSLLRAAKAEWLDRGGDEPHRFHHVSTDEVYGSLGADDPAFSETTAYAPNSPYSASKAGSDHLVRAYHHTFGMDVVTTNCSNNYGPYQFPEKLIPLFLINALEGRNLPIYGDGMNVRDWLFVTDHCRGIELALEKGKPGEVYNIGGGEELPNLTVIETICDVVDQAFAKDPALRERYPDAPAARGEPTESLKTFVEDRKGHDRRYAIDERKARAELGYVPAVDFKGGMERTIAWYLANEDWWRPLLAR
ncbi:dTDP-glucose 4,6-dehydratase [Qipengyuania sp.]|uniref:dTDP-glucose 4,6-dehydratase n=1 Tax=Qipengyuania sp. TaxID=2004515 RepID=UPI0035C7A2F4